MTGFRKNLLAVALAVATGSAGAVELETLEQRFSYVFGTRIAKLLQAQGVESIDAKTFAAGVADALQNSLQMTPEQIKTTLEEKSAADQAAREQVANANLAKGEAYRAENAKRKGVNVLDNGLQYEVLVAGSGNSPTAADKVTVHYRGTLVDGSEFDSSYGRGQPAEFSLQGVVPGFREAIVRMKPGAKWRVVMPPELAYGARGAGSSIGPNETLTFEIELLEVQPAEAKPES
jgi:FKBP-type peptidyl-prolyl cis-trans isomerase FklB